MAMPDHYRRLLICRCSSATAGGYTARATDEYVLVTRNGEQRKALPNTPIRPDDVIRVPERNF
jgi:polysaccharide export outer membrane protein